MRVAVEGLKWWLTFKFCKYPVCDLKLPNIVRSMSGHLSDMGGPQLADENKKRIWIEASISTTKNTLPSILFVISASKEKCSFPQGNQLFTPLGATQLVIDDRNSKQLRWSEIINCSAALHTCRVQSETPNWVLPPFRASSRHWEETKKTGILRL